MTLDKSYDWIISLGSGCPPAWNIRRSFGQTIAFPFDWWISDFYPTISVLRSDFADMFNADEMAIVDQETTVVSKRYWIKYHHDFPHIEGTSKVRGDFLSVLPAVEGKYRRRIERFREILSAENDILFVRSGVEHSKENSVVEMIQKAKMIYHELSKMGPNAKIDMLVIDNALNGQETIQMDAGRLAFDALPASKNPGSHDWHEEDYAALWKRQKISVNHSR